MIVGKDWGKRTKRSKAGERAKEKVTSRKLSKWLHLIKYCYYEQPLLLHLEWRATGRATSQRDAGAKILANRNWVFRDFLFNQGKNFVFWTLPSPLPWMNNLWTALPAIKLFGQELKKLPLTLICSSSELSCPNEVGRNKIFHGFKASLKNWVLCPSPTCATCIWGEGGCGTWMHRQKHISRKGHCCKV